MYKNAQGSAELSTRNVPPVRHFPTFSFLPLDRQIIDDLLQISKELTHGNPVYFSVPMLKKDREPGGSRVFDLHFSTGLTFGHQLDSVGIKTTGNLDPFESVEVVLRKYLEGNPEVLAKFPKRSQELVKEFIFAAQALNKDLDDIQAANIAQDGNGSPVTGPNSMLAMLRVDIGLVERQVKDFHIDNQNGRKTVISNLPTVFSREQPYAKIARFEKRKLKLKRFVSPEPFEAAAFDGQKTIHSWPKMRNKHRETILTRAIPAISVISSTPGLSQ